MGEKGQPGDSGNEGPPGPEGHKGALGPSGSSGAKGEQVRLIRMSSCYNTLYCTLMFREKYLTTSEEQTKLFVSINNIV